MTGPRIDLTGASVWPSKSPLSDHVPPILRRIVYEAFATWSGAGELQAHIEMHARHVLLEALCEATAVHWESQARKFDEIGTPDCVEIATACRNKAAFVRAYGLEDAEAELELVLREIQRPARRDHGRAA